MKKKMFFMLSFVMMFFVSLTFVNADECPTYTNVYLFTELTGYSHISDSSKSEFVLTRQKAMEGLPRGATIDGVDVADMSRADRLALGTWKVSFNSSELSSFWSNYLLADPTGIYKNGNIKYLVNTNYYNQNTSLVGTGTKISGISGISKEMLVNATVMPDNIENDIVNFGINEEDFNFRISRKYLLKTDSRDDLLTVSDTWGNVFVSPAQYSISYQYCGDDNSNSSNGNNNSNSQNVSNHKLTVNYWYNEVGSNKAADSHVETLASGDGYSVDSPKIDGYSASKTNVSGTMGNEDIVIDVIYSAKTGEIAMGIIWFIGLAGLGYGIYYYNKAKKHENEDI